MQLKPDTILQGGKYRIIRTLGQGGFGITYEAKQVNLDRVVAVKEFFMKDCCERDSDSSSISVPTQSNREIVAKFKGKFVREAKMIASFDHPHIVRIIDIFDENGTAYYVMENLPGGSLADKVKKDGPLTEAKADEYIRQVADALAYIHSQDTVHLDIKPSNILLNAKGDAVLIDFGISKHYDTAGEQTSSTPVGISKGYAPLEQGRDGDVSQFKPSTDIYALGATLYYLVSGMVPPEASLVNEDGLKRPDGISDRIWEAIEQAMQPKRKDRPQDIIGFMSLMNAAPIGTISERDNEVTVLNEPKSIPAQEIGQACDIPSVSKSKHYLTPHGISNLKKVWILIITGIVLIVGVLVFILSQRTTPSLKDLVVDNHLSLPSSGILYGHEYVDLGLSVKWATCNVGASSIEDYGDYFAWGETEPKNGYWGENYKFFEKYSERQDEMEPVMVIDLTISKYNTINGMGPVDNKAVLDYDDDAAYHIWGGTWRMPTKDEFKELVKKCTWKWIEHGRISGFVVTSKTNKNSIFLPAAGIMQGSDLHSYGWSGAYWTSNLNVDWPDAAWDKGFLSKDKGFNDKSLGRQRFIGLSIRPVIE